MRLAKKDNNRFRDPLYTVAEASRYLGTPDSTLRDWTHGYRKQRGSSIVQGGPLLTTVTSGPRQPVIPFVGLAEGMILAAMRESGVPLQRIRPAVARLQADIGLEHALASQALVHGRCGGSVRLRRAQRRQNCLGSTRTGGGSPRAACFQRRRKVLSPAHRVLGRRLRASDPAPRIPAGRTCGRPLARVRAACVHPRRCPARRRLVDVLGGGVP